MSNKGVQHTGSGSINAENMAVGEHAAVHVGGWPRGDEAAGDASVGDARMSGSSPCFSEETSALAAALRVTGRVSVRVHDDGSPCHEAEVNASGRRLRVVATQAADRGQRPAVLAFQRLSVSLPGDCGTGRHRRRCIDRFDSAM